MPRITPTDTSLQYLKGVHLWHAPLSSCSQRVRLVLAELGQGFESHLINLGAGEHASAAYQAIHPKGVVPALVDEGALYIESIDIIRHLARDNTALGQVDHDLLDRANGAQLDLKLLTFEFLFRGDEGAGAGKTRRLPENHKNGALRQFYADFDAGFDRDHIDAAVRRTADGFAQLDARLADGRSYLTGDELSISDIAWIPNVHRVSLMGWPLDQTPALAAWFDRIGTRPSYQSALLDWQSEKARTKHARRTAARRLDGTDIRTFGDLT